MVELTILSPQQILYKGEAKSIILPGENGVFEILSFHKNFISRLLSGYIVINNKDSIPIKRGVIKIENNEATIIAEET